MIVPNFIAEINAIVHVVIHFMQKLVKEWGNYGRRLSVGILTVALNEMGINCTAFVYKAYAFSFFLMYCNNYRKYRTRSPD